MSKKFVYLRLRLTEERVEIKRQAWVFVRWTGTTLRSRTFMELKNEKGRSRGVHSNMLGKVSEVCSGKHIELGIYVAAEETAHGIKLLRATMNIKLREAQQQLEMRTKVWAAFRKTITPRIALES